MGPQLSQVHEVRSSNGKLPESNSKRITPHDQTFAAAPSHPLLASSCPGEHRHQHLKVTDSCKLSYQIKKISSSYHRLLLLHTFRILNAHLWCNVAWRSTCCG